MEIPHGKDTILNAVRSLRASGLSARAAHKDLKRMGINVTYSALLRLYAKEVKEEEGVEIKYRSRILGDRTEEIAELVKDICEEERAPDEELLTEQHASHSFDLTIMKDSQIIDELEAEHGVKIGRTVLRSLLKLKGVLTLVDKKVPYITPLQMQKRFHFIDHLISTGENFKNWVWSDESIVQLGGNRRFIRSTDKFDKRRKTGVLKFNKKYMIWACITWDGAGALAFIEPGEKLDGPAYMGIMEEFLLPFIDGCRGRATAVFQQDGAPCHVAKSSRELFDRWGVKLSPWAPSSPDCNPIEYVWRDLKVWVRRNRKPKTLPELKSAIIYYWNHVITKEICRKYITHVKHNMTIIHQVKGAPIVDKWGANNI